MNDETNSDRQIVRRRRLQDEGDDDLLLHLTPAERIKMVWPMTQDCWAFVPGYDAEQEFQRHVGRVERRKG